MAGYLEIDKADLAKMQAIVAAKYDLICKLKEIKEKYELTTTDIVYILADRIAELTKDK